jgi:glycosyltransferase involved in cell wall biosynthesis
MLSSKIYLSSISYSCLIEKEAMLQLDIKVEIFMKKILFVYNTKTTFTKQDLDILAQNFEVKEAFISSPWVALKFLMTHKMSEYDVAYFWFSSLNFYPIFLMAYLQSVKIVIVAGGFDVANVPEIGYGGRTKPLYQRFLRKFFLKKAAHIINVSQSNQKDFLNVLTGKKSEVIYLGFKDPGIKLTPLKDRPKKIITIGAVNAVTFKRKGYCFFAELSKLMPDWEFLIIGKYDEDTKRKLQVIGGSNLKFSGFLSDQGFVQEIISSRFNLQLSFHEGFGVSVVDAALLGVYPLVYDRYSLPEVVENAGSVLTFGDISGVRDEILKINELGYDPEKIKLNYLTRFPYQKKISELNACINSLF